MLKRITMVTINNLDRATDKGEDKDKGKDKDKTGPNRAVISVAHEVAHEAHRHAKQVKTLAHRHAQQVKTAAHHFLIMETLALIKEMTMEVINKERHLYATMWIKASHKIFYAK